MVVPPMVVLFRAQTLTQATPAYEAVSLYGTCATVIAA